LSIGQKVPANESDELDGLSAAESDSLTEQEIQNFADIKGR
jgi:hypothetical protein